MTRSASEMRPYDPSKVNINIGGNVYTGFDNNEITEVDKPHKIELTITLKSIGKVTGFVYLTNEQYLKFNEERI